MSSRTAFALAIVLGLFAFVALRPHGEPSDEIHRLVRGGALLVDVRTPEEFASGHLPNAVSLPAAEVRGRMSELGPRDHAIVVYCSTGARSSNVKRLLTSLGFTDVHDLGPMSNW